MAVAAHAGAFAAKFEFVPQGDMNGAALAAVHRVEAERLTGMFHLFRGGVGAHPQFSDAEHAVIIRIEGETRMVFRRHAERFHGDVFEREQKFRAVHQEQVDIAA